MSNIWSGGEKLRPWLEVELAALEGWAEVGTVPHEDIAAIRERVVLPTPERVAEIERETNHDVAAFVDAASEGLGDEGRWFHYGLTSSDVLDTALSLAVQDAGALLLEGLDRAFGAVVARAEEHRDTICMGRTHGVHAEPTTFGLKLAGWAFALDRDRERLVHAIEGLRVGKLSGAVGTYAAAEPEVERIACERLGLEPAPSSTQVLQRDRDPAPRPYRGARGRGAVRPRPEGLVGDAPQAQSDHGRAYLRDRAGRARQLPRRPRERRPLARAGHLPLLGRADRAARLLSRGRLHARPLHVARRGPRRARGADARERRIELWSL